MMLNGLLAAIVAFAVGYCFFRLRSLKSGYQGPKFFHLFWFWVLGEILLFELVPRWSCSPTLFHMAFVALLGVILMDFLYFYGIKTPFIGPQLASAIWLIPAFLYFGQPLWRGTVAVSLPWFGTARVWTDSMLQPKKWYFLDPDSSDQTEGENFRNPNYGKAVMAPISGRVLEFTNDHFLVLADEGGTLNLAVGPLLVDSVKFQAGARVFESQPLGLLELAPGKIPGLQLHLLKGESLRFKDVAAGRLFSLTYGQAALFRNQLVSSESKNQLKFQPAKED